MAKVFCDGKETLDVNQVRKNIESLKMVEKSIIRDHENAKKNLEDLYKGEDCNVDDDAHLGLGKNEEGNYEVSIYEVDYDGVFKLSFPHKPNFLDILKETISLRKTYERILEEMEG